MRAKLWGLGFSLAEQRTCNPVKQNQGDMWQGGLRLMPDQRRGNRARLSSKDSSGDRDMWVVGFKVWGLGFGA